jgi:hypothetical protein
VSTLSNLEVSRHCSKIGWATKLYYCWMAADPVPDVEDDDCDWKHVVVSILVLDQGKDSREDCACWQSSSCWE